MQNEDVEFASQACIHSGSGFQDVDGAPAPPSPTELGAG